MFQVFYANRMERLVAQLVAQVQAERAVNTLGALAPVHVVVPGGHMASLLKLQMATTCGIVSNLVCTDVETFLEESLRAKNPKTRLLTQRMLRALIVEALHDADWLQLQAICGA